MSRNDPFLNPGDQHPVRVVVRTLGPAVVLVVTGEFDNLAVAAFENVARTAVHGLADRLLVVDISGLGFLGSAGVATLVALHHCLADRLRVVALVAGRVLRPIEISGLHEVLRLYESIDQACHADP